MTPKDLGDEIAIELEAMEITVSELLDLQRDVGGREPTLREKTAAAAFLAQFYNGVENILKRISHYYGLPLPVGETWHVELFQRFSSSVQPDIPDLFNEELASALAPYRRFRHVVFHSYGFQLDWNRMAEGIEHIQDVFTQFKARLHIYLQSISK